jgi:serine/threonine protein kinase
VYRVRNRADGHEYAVKASKKAFRTRNERRLLLREVHNSNILGEHQNLVTYYRAWQDQRSLYLQLELCELGTLRSYVNSLCTPQHGHDSQAQLLLPQPELSAPLHGALAGASGNGAGGAGEAAGSPREGLLPFLPELQVWAFTAQLGAGLSHIHSHGLMHLDVKPENILVSAHGELKIGDLGLCVSPQEWEEEVRARPQSRARDALPPRRRGGRRRVLGWGRWERAPPSAHILLESPRASPLSPASSLFHTLSLSRPLSPTPSPSRARSLPHPLPLAPSLSARSLSPALRAQEGDAVFIAPELLQAKPSTSCDLFSLGLVLYELAAHCDLTADAPSGSEAWHRLRTGQIPFPPVPERSAALQVRASSPLLRAPRTARSPRPRPRAAQRMRSAAQLHAGWRRRMQRCSQRSCTARRGRVLLVRHPLTNPPPAAPRGAVRIVCAPARVARRSSSSSAARQTRATGQARRRSTWLQ